MKQFGLGMLFAALAISILVSVIQYLAPALMAPTLHQFHLQCSSQEKTEVYLVKSLNGDYWAVAGRMYPLETALCEVK